MGQIQYFFEQVAYTFYLTIYHIHKSQITQYYKAIVGNIQRFYRDKRS